jgi:hypothetical protein
MTPFHDPTPAPSAGTRVRGEGRAQRAMAAFRTGITRLTIRATRTPLITSARSASGRDPSSSPKRDRSREVLESFLGRVEAASA